MFEVCAHRGCNYFQASKWKKVVAGLAAGAALGGFGLNQPWEHRAERELGKLLGKSADAVHKVFEDAEEREKDKHREEQQQQHEHDER